MWPPSFLWFLLDSTRIVVGGVLRLGHAREPCRVQYNSQDFAEAARNSSFKNCCSFCTLTPIILSNNYVARITFFYVLQRHQILIQLVTTNLFQIISNVIKSLISCFCLRVSLVILFLCDSTIISRSISICCFVSCSRQMAMHWPLH
jgi:hypothetical protein